MDLSGLKALLDNKLALSAFSAIGGGLLTNLVKVYRARIKVIEYTVTHDRVALSADDALFGTVRVTWQDVPVTNLYVTTVEIKNGTSVDYTNVEFKVWTGTTLLLTERTEMPGTTFHPTYTDGFSEAIRVAPQQVPTDAQVLLFRHNREYRVTVLNRGQRIVCTYLTSVPTANDNPSVWVDMLHPGAQVAFRPTAPAIHGVAVRLALPLGLVACLVLVGLVSAFVTQVWLAAILCMLAGFIAQSIGAWLYQGFKFFKQIVLR